MAIPLSSTIAAHKTLPREEGEFGVLAKDEGASNGEVAVGVQVRIVSATPGLASQFDPGGGAWSFQPTAALIGAQGDVCGPPVSAVVKVVAKKFEQFGHKLGGFAAFRRCERPVRSQSPSPGVSSGTSTPSLERMGS